MRATPGNVELLEAYVAARPDAPAELREWAADVIAEMRRNEGSYTPVRRRTHSEPQVFENPRTVAILVDRYCASSCESFLFAAKQSSKVTVYGENTGGFLDYGNVMAVPTPNPALSLNMPTARSGHLEERAYDNVGIDPDVRIPEGVLMWVEWVRERLP
jgi:C-terminal processing protease CtpA/Prc